MVIATDVPLREGLTAVVAVVVSSDVDKPFVDSTGAVVPLVV